MNVVYLVDVVIGGKLMLFGMLCGFVEVLIYVCVSGYVLCW